MLLLQELSILCFIVGSLAYTWPIGDILKHKRTILGSHNRFRMQQRASNMNKLIWDDELAARAAVVVKSCNFELTETKGENLFARLTTDGTYNADRYIHDAIHAWHLAIASYNIDLGQSQKKPYLGRFAHSLSTNLIEWADTQKVGCAYQTCFKPNLQFRSVYMFFGCLYDPAGNVKGQLPYQRDGPACSGCAEGQWCDLGLCVGNASPCGDRFGWCASSVEKHGAENVCYESGTIGKMYYHWMETHCRKSCKFC